MANDKQVLSNKQRKVARKRFAKIQQPWHPFGPKDYAQLGEQTEAHIIRGMEYADNNEKE